MEINADRSFTFAGLSRCRAAVRIDGGEAAGAWQWQGETLRWSGPQGSFAFAYEADGTRLRISGGGTLAAPVAALEVVLLAIPELAADHIVTQGPAMGRAEALPLPVATPTELTGYYQTLIRRGAESWHLHTPLVAKHPLVLTVRAEGGYLRDLEVKASLLHYGGTEIVLNPLSVELTTAPLPAMITYAAQNRSGHERDVLAQSGWNSWDYYRWTVTEEEVLENARFIAADPVLRQHVKRIIVDDGWQYCYGEWEANSLFPSGMPALARELDRMGFVPGLWFAPGIAEPHSRIAQLHSDMLALGECDLPCLGYSCMTRVGMLLDPTVGQVQQHLHDLFARYTSYGYRYFKLDFLQAVLKGRKFADRLTGRGELVRKLVEPIRRATAGRAMLMGCNYPYYSGTDLVDAVRTGGDIHATWASIKHNSVSIAARYWMAPHLFLCDPDFSLCRSFDTSDDPDLERLRCCHVFVTPEQKEAGRCDFRLVEECWQAQIEVLLSLVLVSAGAINLSDKLTRLNQAGLELARRVVSAERGESGLPLDLFTSSHASCWLQRVGGHHRVLLINWEDEAKVVRFDLGAHGLAGGRLADFWRGQALPSASVLELALAPRSCRLIEVR